MAIFHEDGTSLEVIDWFTSWVMGFVSALAYVLMKSVSRRSLVVDVGELVALVFLVGILHFSKHCDITYSVFSYFSRS